MRKTYSVDATNTSAGPVGIPAGRKASFQIIYTAGTFTPQGRLGTEDAHWDALKDANGDDVSYTAAQPPTLVEGPMEFRILGSSSPDATIIIDFE